jgi:EmrB/QacA subfamily drug resistance transporter
MGVVLIGTFMVILDTTIVNVALPAIGQELQAGNGIEWIVTAYLLAVGLSTPASGWLADRFGRKRTFLVSLAAFTAGSLAAALAPNLPVLVAFRVLQGLGGGAMMPVGMAMIYELFPPEKRGSALGIWGVAAMAAPAMGPVIGGYLATSVSWRWLFAVNVPLGVAGLAAGMRLLRDTGYRERRPFDLWGLVLVGGGLVLWLLAFSEGTDLGWTSPTVVAMLAAGGSLLVGFAVVELRSGHPLIELRMFGVPAFSITIGIVWAITIAQFGRLVFVPLELEGPLRGLTALHVGLLLTPSALGAALTMPFGGRLSDHIGPRVPVISGVALLTVSALGLGRLDLQSSEPWIAFLLFVGGLGTGLAMMPNTVTAMNVLPGRFTAQASAVRSMNRQVAGAMGVAVLASVFESRVGGSTDPATVQSAYNAVFLCGAAVCVVALLLAFFLPSRAANDAIIATRIAEGEHSARIDREVEAELEAELEAEPVD